MKYFLGKTQEKVKQDIIKLLERKKINNNFKLLYEQMPINNPTINFNKINENEIVNTLVFNNSNRFEIGIKNKLFRYLIDYYIKLDKYPFDKIPVTLNLNNNIDKIFYSKLSNKKFLTKATDLSCGRGIEIYNKKDTNVFIQELFNKEPFCIDNRVIGLRIYVLYTWINGNLNVYIYNKFLLQKSKQNYDKNNYLTIITNYIPKIYNKNERLFYFWENNVIYNKNEKIQNKNYMKIFNNAKSLIIDITNSIKPHLKKTSYRSFQNCAFDFLIDKDFNLFLCECNDQYGFIYQEKENLENVLNILEETIDIIDLKKEKKFTKII